MDAMQAPQPNQSSTQVEITIYNQNRTELRNPHLIHIVDPSQQTGQGQLSYHQTAIQLQELSPQITLASCNNQTNTRPQSMETTLMQSNLEVSQSMQPLQIGQDVILPMLKQHNILMDGLSHSQHYYTQFAYQKEQPNCVEPKLEPDIQISLKGKFPATGNENNNTKEVTSLKQTKRSRKAFPEPEKWACNVRKLKHQRGEAYINRRGKYVPEKQIKNTKDCLKGCLYKCYEQIKAEDRERIFKAFYCLSANEKKHYLLTTTERNYTKRQASMLSKNIDVCRRKYSFKYFFFIRSVKYFVCKNFYLGTLAISQKPVYNVHLGKSDLNIPKPDGRGLSESSTQGIPEEMKDRVRKHIMSFTTIDSKPIVPFSPKKQYLYPNMSIKQMYKMYVNECAKDNLVPTKESMYRKIFNREFHIDFKKVKMENQVLCSKCKEPVKKK